MNRSRAPPSATTAAAAVPPLQLPARRLVRRPVGLLAGRPAVPHRAAAAAALAAGCPRLAGAQYASAAHVGAGPRAQRVRRLHRQGQLLGSGALRHLRLSLHQALQRLDHLQPQAPPERRILPMYIIIVGDAPVGVPRELAPLGSPQRARGPMPKHGGQRRPRRLHLLIPPLHPRQGGQAFLSCGAIMLVAAFLGESAKKTYLAVSSTHL